MSHGDAQRKPEMLQASNVLSYLQLVFEDGLKCTTVLMITLDTVIQCYNILVGCLIP